MGYKFSKTSFDRLKTCHPYIQKVMLKAIELSDIDFGIAQGARTIEQQRQYFKDGKSKINPDAYTSIQLPHKAKHIVNEVFPLSGAVDVYAWVNGQASWETKDLTYIAGVIKAVDGMNEDKLRWGGNWDNDGVIIDDQKFQDLPHHELKKRISE